MEDAGLVWVVQVGRLEQELHHPLAWQGWQSGQEVVLSQVQFLLDLVDGIPQPGWTFLHKFLFPAPEEQNA